MWRSVLTEVRETRIIEKECLTEKRIRYNAWFKTIVIHIERNNHWNGAWINRLLKERVKIAIQR
jgi:hypothetical protein